MEKNLRVAVVGCGAIAPNHVNGILSAGHRICALCDIDKSAAEAIADKFELDSKIYTDYIGMLEAERPDSVHICTPHYLHAKMCVEALSRDINVLCEKPLCINRTEIARVIEAADRSSATLGVCLQNRYEPKIKKLFELAGDEPRAVLGVVSWKRDEKYYASGEWRGKWLTEGGGVMINQAIHTLDLVAELAGEIKCVTAHVSNDSLKDVIEVEDTASALFETVDGRRANFYATNSCGGSFPAQLHVVTKYGDKLYADTRTILKNGVPVYVEDDSTEQIGKAVWGKGHAILISDFYRAVIAGEKFPIDAREGSKVLRLIFSIYESNGKKTDIY